MKQTFDQFKKELVVTSTNSFITIYKAPKDKRILLSVSSANKFYSGYGLFNIAEVQQFTEVPGLLVKTPENTAIPGIWHNEIFGWSLADNLPC